MDRHSIAIVVGSLRAGSINRKVARSICAFAADKLDCRIVEIGDLPLYSQDYDAAPPPEYVRFRKEIAAADGILFCTPEYNRGVPGVLKNAVDVGSRPYGETSGTGSRRRSSARRRAESAASAPTTSCARPASSSTCR